MKTKPEIKEKLLEAEKAHDNASGTELARLFGVIETLRWVLDLKITNEPKDPVSEK